MKRWLPIITALSLMVCSGVGPAYALGSNRLRANVPFDFKVGKATLPAGTYDVSYDDAAAPGILMVRSKDGHRAVVVLAENVDTRNPARDARLVFEREGQTMALSEIFGAQARSGLEVVGTHANN